MKIIDILASKLGLNDSEYSQVDRWLKTVENTNLTTGNLSNSTGGGVRSLVEGNVEIGLADGITLRNPFSGARTIYLDPDGDAWFGSDTEEPATTSMFVISNAQDYNGETFGAGDLLVGDNSTGKANMLWDVSAGTLKFRAGTTVAGSVGTGGIDFQLGSIGGWNFNATTLYDDASTIVLDSSVPNITVATNKVILSSAGITAIGGTVGGWTLASTTLTGGNITLDAGNNKITVGSGIILDGANQKITVGASGTTVDILGATKVIQSSNYASQATGWQIDSDGNAEFNNITARGTLKTAVFQRDNVIATGGRILVSKNASEIYADVTTPATLTSFTIQLKNDDANAVVAAVNDVLWVKGFNGTSTQTAWFTVTSVSFASTASTYTCDLESGTNQAFKKGMAVVNIGPSGAGAIDLEAGTTTTRMRIWTHAGSPWSTVTNQVIIGNLRDTYGAGSNDRYGIGVGDYSGGNYMSYNADGAGTFTIKAGDGNITLSDAGLTVNPATSDLWSGVEGVSWANATHEIAHIRGFEISTRREIDIEFDTPGDTENDSRDRTLRLRAYAATGRTSTVAIAAADGDGSTNLSYISMNNSSGMTLSADSGQLNLYSSSNVYVRGVSPSTDIAAIITSDAGQIRDLRWSTGTSARWILRTDNVAESGSSAGSNLILRNYTDAGSGSNLLQFVRSSGDIIYSPASGGDLYTDSWQNWYSSSTVTGWSSFTTTRIYYKKIGRMVFLHVNLVGTSNATTAQITLPYANSASNLTQGYARTCDNGTWYNGIFSIPDSGTVCAFYPSVTGTGWTATGNKQVRVSLMYMSAT